MTEAPLARLSFSCKCGSVAGELFDVGPDQGTHCVCYCSDCRAFGQLCGGETLDARGGTALFQTSSARLRLDRGHEHIECVRLSEKGMNRWRAICCGAALTTTVRSSWVTLAGVIDERLGSSAAEREAAVGPVRGAVFFRDSGVTPLHPPLGAAGVAGAAIRAMKVLTVDRLKRRRPALGSADGVPTKPRILPPATVAELKARPVQP